MMQNLIMWALGFVSGVLGAWWFVYSVAYRDGWRQALIMIKDRVELMNAAKEQHHA